MARHVGVDGCRFGWVAVTQSHGALQFQLFSRIDELVRSYWDAAVIAIDIPIGLPWSAVPIRSCDALARACLGPRRSSVFPVPCRAALGAPTIADARRLNVRELGRSLSTQAWAIAPKIREVDDLLRQQPDARPLLCEVHPEVCFWGLNGGRPMAHAKSSKHGATERLDLLEQYVPEARSFTTRVLAQRLRKEVRLDDVVDALVALVTASSAAPSVLVGEPGCDELGLPMRMLYLDGAAAASRHAETF
jgi:predicted RNase H-like nuclease